MTSPSATSASPPSRKARLRRIAAVVGVQAVLILLALEVLGRVANPQGISFYPESAKFFDKVIREEPIGYRLPPGMRGEFWGAPVEINSLGMRDREVPPRREGSGEFRILILGDSVPFGLGVPYEDSIPALLERALAERAPQGVRFRTLNMGVPSYNTEQARVALEEVGLGLQPDLVTLFYAFNDIESKTWALDKRKNPIVNLAQRSYATSLLGVICRQLQGAIGGRSIGVQAKFYEPRHPRWMATERALREIDRLTREAGIPFMVLTIIGPDFPDARRLVRGVGASAGFPVVSILPWTDPRFSSLNRVEYQNSPLDGHPNPAGARIYTQLVLEALERSGFLPGGEIRVTDGR